MFELYTEKARRVIFFGRYEASQYGSPYIETEHLLLGVLREDNALAYRVLRSAATIGSVREQIDRRHARTNDPIAAKDLPLSEESKRVLTYGAEESRRMKHKHIVTAHLVLGLLREEKCFAAGLLRERGLQLERLREEIKASNPDSVETGSSQAEPPPALVQLLLGWEESGGIKVIAGAKVGNNTPDFAVYSIATEDTSALDRSQIAHLKREIRLTAQRMEDAIARHDFDGARKHSDEERILRASLRQNFVQHNVIGPLGWELTSPAPFLCIEIVRDESSPHLQKRIDDYLSAGVERVWVLDFPAQRTYTVTAADGQSELTKETPWLLDRGLSLDLNRLFA